MLEIQIPGREKSLRIKSVVLDYNGTIARDGQLLGTAAERIQALCGCVDVYVLTADTYGNVEQQCRELGEGVCAVGNGFNDIQMFDAAELAIAVMEKESVCAGLLPHADVLVAAPEDALDLLLKPDRLRATLRN